MASATVETVVTRDELDAQIQRAKGDGVILCIDFWAPWCGPCRMMTPAFEEFAEKYAGKCIFIKIDVDKSEVIAQTYNVKAMPTFVIVKDGEKVDELLGASKEKLEAMIIRNVPQ